jgi:hypothetical protein
MSPYQHQIYSDPSGVAATVGGMGLAVGGTAVAIAAPVIAADAVVRQSTFQTSSKMVGSAHPDLSTRSYVLLK